MPMGPCLGHSHTLGFYGQEIVSGSIVGPAPSLPWGQIWQLVDKLDLGFN